MRGAWGRERLVAWRGSTLLELMVVVVIMGIMAAMAAPSYERAIEQSRVDQAAATLRSIWAAQRFYRLDKGHYAGSLGELEAVRLIGEVSEDASNWDEPYRFALVLTSDGEHYTLTATRQGIGSGSWAGQLALDETGRFAGDGGGCVVRSWDGRVVAPSSLYLAR